MFSFLALINNSVITRLSFLLLTISPSYHQKQVIFYVSYLECIGQCFYKYHPYNSSVQ